MSEAKYPASYVQLELLCGVRLEDRAEGILMASRLVYEGLVRRYLDGHAKAFALQLIGRSSKILQQREPASAALY